MKTTIAFLAAIILAPAMLPAYGTGSSIICDSSAPASPVSIKVPAEFLEATITLGAGSDSLDDQVKLVDAAKAVIEAASKTAGVTATPTPTVLVERSDMKGKLISSFSSDPNRILTAHSTVTLRLPITPASDVVQSQLKLMTLFKDLKLAKKTEASFSSIVPGVANPEARRDDLLKLIGTFAAKGLRQTVGDDGRAVIDGLDAPVQVRPTDDPRQLELSIPFRMGVQGKE